MNVILPIHKKYSDRIFSGLKPYEFRNRVPKLEKYDKVFVYETKKYGCGMVVGYFTVKDVEKIQHHKLGAYGYLSDYVHRYYNEEVQQLVDKAMTIDLNNCDNSLVLSYFLMEDCLDEMLKTKRPPENSFNNMLFYRMSEYNQAKKLQTEIIESCDDWLRDMGFYNTEFGEKSEWEYRIVIADTCKYNNPIPITDFLNKDGNSIKKAPQSFCYTINK